MQDAQKGCGGRSDLDQCIKSDFPLSSVAYIVHFAILILHHFLITEVKCDLDTIQKKGQGEK